MADQKDDLESENQDNGGETIDKKTTEEGSKDFKQIAEDQRKRAEIAEAKLKKPKVESEKPVEIKDKINSQSSDPVELAKLANVLTGMSDEAITQLTAVAKAKNLSLAEAKKDPLFTAWFDQVSESAKREEAKRGASRGSSDFNPDEEPMVKSGMTRDDHKALFDKLTGRK